eukprot:1767184-Pyramimonas_sp.AAC.1
MQRERVPCSARGGRSARIRDLAAAWAPAPKRITLQAVADQRGAHHHVRHVHVLLLSIGAGHLRASTRRRIGPLS